MSWEEGEDLKKEPGSIDGMWVQRGRTQGTRAKGKQED